MRAFTHAEARRLVSDGRERAIRDLHRLNDGRRWLDLAAYVGLWAAGAALSLWAWDALQGPARWGAVLGGWVLSAIALNANILLVHEAMHGVLFSGKRLNRWAGAFFGWSVFMSYAAYQVQHLRHHAFLGTHGDPDEYGNYAQPGWKLWALHCLRVAAGSYIYLAVIPYLSWPKAKGEQKRQMLEDYAGLAVVLGVVLWALPLQAFLLAWFGPLLFVNFMMNTRGLTQHSLAEPGDAFLASRDIRSGALVRFCLMQENYHLAHHLYPRVPSYKLHACDQLLRDRYPRQVAGPGYLWFLGRFAVALWRRDFSPIGVEVARR